MSENFLKTREFKKVFKKGKIYKRYLYRVFVKKIDNSKLKFGIVASRKVGNAVTRNRAKRLFREFIRLNKWFDLTGYAIIFIVIKADWQNIKLSYLLNDFKELSNKVNSLINKPLPK